MTSIRERLEEEGGGWPGVEDLPVPVRIREELVGSGKAQVHHVLPQTGWVSYRIRGSEDVDGALELFRKNDERLTARKGVQA